MPSTRMSPSVGVSRSATARKSVVLPQPEGPMKETNSPRATFRLTWLSASTGPSRVSKRSDTSLTSIAGSSPALGLTAAAAVPGIDAVSIAGDPLARDRAGSGELLVALQRAGVGREGLAADEPAAADLRLHPAVAEHDLAARQRVARQPVTFMPSNTL